MSPFADNKAIAKAAMALLREADKIPPRERFEQMVRSGLIDREGRLTTLVGGDAEPDASAAPRVKGASP